MQIISKKNIPSSTPKFDSKHVKLVNKKLREGEDSWPDIFAKFNPELTKKITDEFANVEKAYEADTDNEELEALYCDLQSFEPFLDKDGHVIADDSYGNGTKLIFSENGWAKLTDLFLRFFGAIPYAAWCHRDKHITET